MSVISSNSPRVLAYRRHRAGVPLARAGTFTARGILSSMWLWLAVGLGLIYLTCVLILRRTLGASVNYDDGSYTPGLNGDAIWQSARYALPTLLGWTVLFVLLDRFRPWRWLVWLLTIGWGACAAVTIALFVNTWAGDRMAVLNLAPGVSDPRPAVFIAPFVEEAAKATIIFLLAFMARERFSSKVSGVVIGGLAGAGFAFTENIVYYARAIVYGSATASTGDVQAAVHQLVLMRGLYTSFGHEMFTGMTGLGIAIGVRNRSKIVRVVAPIAGYLAAATLHMLFNGVSSIIGDVGALIQIYLWIVLPFVVVLLVAVVIAVLRQGRMLRVRLSDYVLMGWLPNDYPLLFSKLRLRLWAICMSPWYGNIVETIRLQRAVSELAYLRDAMTRGLVDEAGQSRERELIGAIRQRRAHAAIDDPRGLRPYFWRRRSRPAPRVEQPAFYPAPAIAYAPPGVMPPYAAPGPVPPYVTPDGRSLAFPPGQVPPPYVVPAPAPVPPRLVPVPSQYATPAQQPRYASSRVDPTWGPPA